MIKTCSDAIHSPMFWAYAQLVDTLGGMLEDLSSWTESCDCHAHISTMRLAFSGRASRISADIVTKNKIEGIGSAEAANQAPRVTCKLRGRRAPEFAAGAFESFLDDVMSTGYSQLTAAMAPLQTGDSALLQQDWLNATAAWPRN